MSHGVVADGYMTATDSYTGYMYVFGKGKSATTVTAPDVVIQKGSGVVIKGTVLDLSQAQPGTPCVSKESMTQQMEYLHLQRPIGGLWQNETTTGVPVLLTAVASDGTAIDLGTATTNGYSGVFSLAWTPPEVALTRSSPPSWATNPTAAQCQQPPYRWVQRQQHLNRNRK